MKILVFDSDETVRALFTEALSGHEIIFSDKPLHDDVLKIHPDAECLSVFVASTVSKEHLAQLSNLKLIVARSTGVDHIDVVAAHERGIIVSNVPRYGMHTVAEFTFALMLSLSRKICRAHTQIREEGDFHITEPLEGFDLFGKTLGVIGTGAIGGTVVGIARGFGMEVRMCDVRERPELVSEHAHYVSRDELFATSDIITLHTPYTPENHHLLNADAFSKMKRGVVILNTARGELIETGALVEALQNGTVSGAGLDVLEGERALKDEAAATKNGTAELFKSLVQDHVLADMPNVIITPHIGFFSREAYREILAISVENILAFNKGCPQNIVE